MDVLCAWMLGLLVACVAPEQPALAQDAQQEFSAALGGKQLVLRSFSAEAEVHYRWVDGALLSDAGHYLTFGIFAPEKVSYGRNRVTINGHRQTAALDEDTHMLVAASQRDPVRVVVDTGVEELTQILPKLRGALFFDNFRLAAEAVPAGLQPQVPLHRTKTAVHGSRCGRCLAVSAQGQGKEEPLANVTPPRLLHAAEPDFTDEARQHKVEGTVNCGLIVSESGKVDTIWLLWPLGSGLDAKARDALKQYVFAPAQQSGVPVSSYVRVEVNFQMR